MKEKNDHNWKRGNLRRMNFSVSVSKYVLSF